MAVKTTYDLYDILTADGVIDLSIMAKDKNGHTQTVITSDDTISYYNRKYPTRRYSILKGQAVTVSEGKADFEESFILWIKNRQKNIDLQYQALFDYPFSPIENVDRYEVEQTITDNDTTYGKVTTNGGNDTTTHTGTDADAHTGTRKDAHTGTRKDDHTGTDSTKQSGDIEHETERAGFNAPNAYTKAEKLTDAYNNKIDATTYDNHNIQTDNLTDQTTYNDTLTTTHDTTDTLTHGHTLSDTGQDQTDIEVNRSLHVHGNIGVTKSTELINDTIELYLLSFAEMLLDNFINDYTYYS